MSKQYRSCIRFWFEADVWLLYCQILQVKRFHTSIGSRLLLNCWSKLEDKWSVNGAKIQ